jgi:broad specificity phosphatase PhoE
VLTSRILLVRHGRSAHVHDPGWVDAADVRRWRAAYDEAAIAVDDRPPAALVAEAARAAVVAASDAPRAVASAERIARGRPIVTSPLLRETALEIPRWLPLRWPLAAWEAAIHLQWAWRILRGTDAPAAELERAAEAAAWLADHARDGATVLAVTHGVFRRLLARQLLAEGCIAEPGRRSYRPWSVWGFRR